MGETWISLWWRFSLPLSNQYKNYLFRRFVGYAINIFLWKGPVILLIFYSFWWPLNICSKTRSQVLSLIFCVLQITKDINSHIYWGKIFLTLKSLDSWYYYYYRWYQWKAPKSKLFSRLTFITVNFKIFTDITVFVDIKHCNF